MPLTVRSHNRVEPAYSIEDAKAIAKIRAENFVLSLSREDVSIKWCDPSAWPTADDRRSHGGYAIVDGDGNDIAEGCAVIDGPFP